MNNETINDLFFERLNDYVNEEIEKLILENNAILKDNLFLEIEYNIDGTKKDIYTLSSEKDIFKMQIESNKNEYEYKFNQNQLSKDEYDKKIKELNEELINKSEIYDDLIFEIINKKSVEEIKKQVEEKKLNDIDLKRLSMAIKSIANSKINEFQKNNKNFQIDNLSYWNYKYDKLAKNISKAREVENIILNLIDWYFLFMYLSSIVANKEILTYKDKTSYDLCESYLIDNLDYYNNFSAYSERLWWSCIKIFK